MPRRLIVFLVVLVVGVLPALAQTLVTGSMPTPSPGSVVWLGNGIIRTQSFSWSGGVLGRVDFRLGNNVSQYPAFPLVVSLRSTPLGSDIVSYNFSFLSANSLNSAVFNVDLVSGTYYIVLTPLGGSGSAQYGLMAFENTNYSSGTAGYIQSSSYLLNTSRDIWFGVYTGSASTSTPSPTVVPTLLPSSTPSRTPSPTASPTPSLGSWCRLLDFRGAVSHGFSSVDGASLSFAGWSPASSDYPDSLFIGRDLSQYTTVTGLSMIVTGGFYSGGQYYFWTGSSYYPNLAQYTLNAPEHSIQGDVTFSAALTNRLEFGLDSRVGDITPFSGWLYAVQVSGVGVNPFTTGSDCLTYPTPSPVPTLTSSPTLTASPTLLVRGGGYYNSCVGAETGIGSLEYQRSCSHCVVSLTATATATATVRPTSTPRVTVNPVFTLTPSLTPRASSTPSWSDCFVYNPSMTDLLGSDASDFLFSGGEQTDFTELVYVGTDCVVILPSVSIFAIAFGGMRVCFEQYSLNFSVLGNVIPLDLFWWAVVISAYIRFFMTF